jgi:hypothetical protein
MRLRCCDGFAGGVCFTALEVSWVEQLSTYTMPLLPQFRPFDLGLSVSLVVFSLYLVFNHFFLFIDFSFFDSHLLCIITVIQLQTWPYCSRPEQSIVLRKSIRLFNFCHDPSFAEILSLCPSISGHCGGNLAGIVSTDDIETDIYCTATTTKLIRTIDLQNLFLFLTTFSTTFTQHFENVTTFESRVCSLHSLNCSVGTGWSYQPIWQIVSLIPKSQNMNFY